MKRFDLMMDVNARGAFLCTQACLPHLKASAGRGRNPHVLTIPASSARSGSPSTPSGRAPSS